MTEIDNPFYKSYQQAVEANPLTKPSVIKQFLENVDEDAGLDSEFVNDHLTELKEIINIAFNHYQHEEDSYLVYQVIKRTDGKPAYMQYFHFLDLMEGAKLVEHLMTDDLGTWKKSQAEEIKKRYPDVIVVNKHKLDIDVSNWKNIQSL